MSERHVGAVEHVSGGVGDPARTVDVRIGGGRLAGEAWRFAIDSRERPEIASVLDELIAGGAGVRCAAVVEGEGPRLRLVSIQIERVGEAP